MSEQHDTWAVTRKGMTERHAMDTAWKLNTYNFGDPYEPVRIPHPPQRLRVTANARDAARYRWLRDEAWSDESDRVPCVHITDENGNPVDEVYGDGLDTAIDAAMEGGE